MTLRNFGGELLQARRCVSATRTEDVRAAVLRARAEGARIRPFGTRFTLSDVTAGDDVFVGMSAMPRTPALLTPRSGRRLVRVPASTTIAEVTAYLRPRGMMLETTPNFTGVSFVGACATGSHGASVHHAPLGACIRAFEIIDGLGRHRWITRDGDPECVPFDAVPERDALLFDALLVHLGAMACVVSLVIEPVPAFFVTERRELTDWCAVRRAFASDELEEIDTLAALVCPYEVNGVRAASIARHTRHATLPGRHPLGADTPAQMAHMYLSMLQAMVRFRLSPRSIPEHLASALPTFARDRLVEGEGSTFMGTDFLGMPPRGVALELAIPFDRQSAPARAQMLERIDEVFVEIEAARSRGRFVGGYLSLRFSQRWDAPLATTEGADTAYVEILVVDGTPRQRDVLRDLEEALRPRGLRRHLGLLHHHAKGELKALYPQHARWMKARDATDPEGLFVGPYVLDNGLAERREWAQAAE